MSYAGRAVGHRRPDVFRGELRVVFQQFTVARALREIAPIPSLSEQGLQFFLRMSISTNCLGKGPFLACEYRYVVTNETKSVLASTRRRGIAFQTLPSRTRPVTSFLGPPHCLKKNAALAFAH